MKQLRRPEERALCDMADRIADSVGSRVFPAQMADPAFRTELADFMRCAMASITAVAMGQSGAVPAARAPQFGKWLAEQGCPVGTVRDAYWLAMRQVLDQWTAFGFDDGASVPVDQVTRVTSAALDFTERGVRYAVEAHDAVTAALDGNGEPDRCDLVRSILSDSATIPAAQAEATLCYPMSASHVSIVVHSPDRNVAARLLSRVQSATQAQATLMLALTPLRWTLWLGFAGRGRPEIVRTVRTALVAERTATAMGGPRTGLAGFRLANDEAWQAERLRTLLRSDAAALVFDDLALDAILLRDPPAARAFALSQLGELAADSPRAERIRETLTVWLTTGSQTATADQLGIHLNSVRLRLNTAGEALGPGGLDRRTELLTALRITDAVGAAALQRGAERPGL
ncbi:MAG TPA: helix-turn-helix domain-containing protein [Pseudonocardiaceae bacterium]|jgi:hypothetical protein|nr:helix-turn-helix domain-containing protein [Pseudonocardiaceae bacterium]